MNNRGSAHQCDIFISYRRDGGDMTAMHFYHSLKARGYKVFFDLEVLRTGRFNEALLEYIRNCTDFLLILSPRALDRCGDEGDWVRREIAEALKHKKNIIPVMMKGFAFPDALPADIADIRFQNGLSSSSEYFAESLDRLCVRYLHAQPSAVKVKLPSHLLVPVLATVTVLAVAFGVFMALRKPEVVPEIIEIIEVTVPPASDTPVPEPTAEPGPPLVRETDFPELAFQMEDDAALKMADAASVVFLPSIQGAPEGAWDVSEAGDGRVLAWATPNGGLFDLTIAGDGGVKLKDGFTFSGCDSLTRVDFNHCVDLSERMDFAGMFRGCASLCEINFDGVSTEHAIGMDGMFEGCSSLTALDLSGFDTGRVEWMEGMFRGCESLTELDISHFATGRVVTFKGTFEGCAALKAFDLGGLDTSLATDLSDMFKGCESLTELNVSGFDTGRATDMSGMFDGCANLNALDVSGFDTSRVTTMRDMFHACVELVEVDVSRFDTGRVEDMQGMFSFCMTLPQLEVSGFDTARVTDMSRMFEYCLRLDGLDLTRWNTANVTDMNSMFSGCSALYRLDLHNFDTARVENMAYMFYNCTSMVELVATGWDVSAVNHMNHIFDGCVVLETIGRDPYSLLHGGTLGAFDNCDRLAGLAPTEEPEATPVPEVMDEIDN